MTGLVSARECEDSLTFRIHSATTGRPSQLPSSQGFGTDHSQCWRTFFRGIASISRRAEGLILTLYLATALQRLDGILI